MIDAGSILTVASIVAGFGVTVLMFRIQRELDVSTENWRQRKPDVESQGLPTWLTVSDFLAIAAVIIALLLAVVPLLRSELVSAGGLSQAAAACSAATVLLAGYVPSILAHYNFLFGLHKQRPYITLFEGLFSLATVVFALITYLRVLGSFT
jgi:small-conductance mechanosensitive channel